MAIAFVGNAALAQAARHWTYKVQPGDTLENLTDRYLQEPGYWRKLQGLNRVRDPLRLAPGTALRIPLDWLRALPATANVVTVSGEASVSVAGEKELKRIAAGTKLASGDVLHTGRDGNVTLEFQDGSRLLLRANSELLLASLRMFANTDFVETRVRVSKGRAETLVKPLRTGPNRFEIESPAAVTAVRGTDYRINAESDAARVEVLDGRVAVSNSRGARELSRGFGTLAERDRAPLPPVTLLPAPEIRNLPAFLERAPIAFTITPLAGARGYRMQIASDASFETLLADVVSSSESLRGPDIPDGEYLAQVRGLDGNAIEGYAARYRFTLAARPEPPLPMTPRTGASVPEELPRFEWTLNEAALRYHFQLSAERGFGTLLLDEAAVSASTIAAREALPPGRYYWRVASVDARKRGPFSAPNEFRRPMPSPDLAGGGGLSAAELVLMWRAGAPDLQFHVQLASNREFVDPIVDLRTREQTLLLPRPQPGQYFVRIKTIESDGFEGTFGPIQIIDIPHGSHW